MAFVLASREAVVQPRDHIGELGLREIESMVGDLVEELDEFVFVDRLLGKCAPLECVFLLFLFPPSLRICLFPFPLCTLRLGR